MRHRTRLPGLVLRHTHIAIIPLIAIGLGSGCSDPPNPVPLQKLTAQVSTADRFVVAASGDYADPNFKPVEIKGPEKAAQFLATLEFSSKRRFYHSPIHAEYSIQCFSNDQPLVVLRLPGYRPAFLSWEHPDSFKEGGVLKRSSLNTMLAWLATNGCDIRQREQAAEDAAKQRRSQAEQDCVVCFPAEARELLDSAPYGTEIPPWAAKRGQKLAAVIRDPVRLTIMTCKGFGCLRDYNYDADREQILLAAMTTVAGPDLAAGLKAIEGDRNAILGASHFFFRRGYGDKLQEPQAGLWRAKISEVVFNDGQEERFAGLFRTLSEDQSPAVHTLLQKLARGETGKTYAIRGPLKYDPLPRPSAFLCLALQGDTDIKPAIDELLTKTNHPIDRAALELALAIIAPTNHLRAEHFNYSSSLLESATLKTVEKFPTTENLDALVSGGITRHEAAQLFEKLVHNHWPLDARFDGEIKLWWEARRASFRQ